MLKALESGATTGLLFCLLFWVGLKIKKREYCYLNQNKTRQEIEPQTGQIAEAVLI